MSDEVKDPLKWTTPLLIMQGFINRWRPSTSSRHQARRLADQQLEALAIAPRGPRKATGITSTRNQGIR